MAAILGMEEMKQISQCLSNQGAPSETSESPPHGPSLPATRSTQSPAPATEALRPASAKEMALVLNDLISVYGVPAGWDASARVYRDLWGALPADVLRDAVRPTWRRQAGASGSPSLRTCWGTHKPKWTPGMPRVVASAPRRAWRPRSGLA